MQDQLENALAWFRAAPSSVADGVKENAKATAEWIWGVVQGDFNEDPTTAQTVTGMVISMIPLVDQICDVRDIVACSRRIDRDPDNTGNWLALGLTLVGLFPTLGSLVKGCGKILFAYARKAALKAGTQAADAVAVKLMSHYLEYGIVKLNGFLDRPEVRKTLKVLHWDNPYKHLAGKIRELRGQVNVSSLLRAFDQAIAALKDLMKLVQDYGSSRMGDQALALLKLVDGVRKRADTMLGKIVKPLQDWLDRIARRLEVESDNAHRAYLKVTNPHGLTRPTPEAELEVFTREKPNWVDKTRREAHPPAREVPIKEGWPDLNSTSGPNGQSPLANAYSTFERGKINAVTIPPGETLYRILDPNSGDNRICWMRKAEFDRLMSKDDWRRRFAVWASWNSNGEFVTYTVPPGKGLNVWEGPAASQYHRLNENYKLEGGGIQIVLDPEDLVKEHLGKRQPTNWGYSNWGESVEMTGVPVLMNNWF